MPTNKTNRIKITSLRGLSVATVAMLGITSVQVIPQSPLAVFASAAEVDPGDEQSWKDVFADNSLSGDTSPVVEGTNKNAAYTHATGTQQSEQIGKVITWDSVTATNLTGKSEDEVGPTPWAFNPVDELLKHYDKSSVSELPVDDLGLITTDGIPYMIPGMAFQVMNGNELYYVPSGTDYSKMSPLSSGSSSYTFEGIGTWEFPSTDYGSSTPITSGNDLLFKSKFTPVKAYAGPVPPLPLYINDANGNPQLHYLTTDEADPTTNTPRTTSRDLYSTTGAIQNQTTQVTINSFTGNPESTPTNHKLDFIAQNYRLLDPNAPAGTEGALSVTKDCGTYSFNRLGQVQFTPDPDYEAKAKAGTCTLNAPLEGVDIVFTQPVTAEIVNDGVKTGNMTLDSATLPLYKLPKDDPRRTWVVQRYQPQVNLQSVEVTDLSAFGKMGSPIKATPDYSQDGGMLAIDLSSVSFVDTPTGDPLKGTYPIDPEDPTKQKAVREKVVSGEGTWNINDDGSITFTPENGFAGHPTPVYYMAKNTAGKVSVDDGDNTDGRQGVAKVTYTYSDASGLVANTFGKQGQTQSSFTKVDGYTDVGNVFNQVDGHGIMFRNVPANWYDEDFFRLLDADGNKVTEVSIDGEGTYKIDAKTGEVTFTPVATFVGTATPARITIADTDYYRTDVKDEYGIVQSDAPIANYTPTVEPGDILVRDAYAVGGIGATVTMTPDYSQLQDSHKPVLLNTVSFLNEDGSYPEKPILTKAVDGEGTWTIDPATGSFTFEPVPGFAGNPTPQPYSAKNEDGLVAKAANVSAIYGGVIAIPATTVGLQNTTQYSDDDDASDNGLTRDEMFPDLPDTWFTNKGGPLTTKLVDKDGNKVNSVTVDGQGTYTIDPNTGRITFVPLATFNGKADPVTVAIDGLKNEEGKEIPVSTTYTPFVTKDGTVLPNAFEQAEETGKAWSVTPGYTDNGYTIDPKSVTFPDGTRTQVVDGEGTWTIDPDTGEFTFTPEVGFNGSPTPVAYDGVNSENNLKATGGQVTITYPLPVTKPATTAAEQGVTQISTDTGDQDAGLTPSQMFPTVPEDWYGEEGDPVQFFIKDANGNNVKTLTVSTKDQKTGETVEAGTYTIDPITGVTTFKPNPSFLGAAPAATIVTEGLSENLETEYTPYYYPARVELPSDRQVQNILGQPTSSQFDLDEWKTDYFTVDKNTIKMLDKDGNKVEGNTYVVDGEGTWTLELVGDAPAAGEEDTREVKFTFTPEKGFIGQPSELLYTASNTNGVESDVPGQVVFVYPTATPKDAVTTAPQGVVQNSTDKDAGDQGLTKEEMFPRIAEVPEDWNITFEIDGATDNKLVVDGQGTYEINPTTGEVTFTPLATFTGTAKPATIWVLADGERTEASAKYTPVVEGFGNPEYHQVVVNTGETKTSPITPPEDAPEGAPTYTIDESFTAPAGWTVTINEETGEVTAVAPKNESQMVAFEVPVTATYPGGVTRKTDAPFSPLKGNMGSPEYKQVVVNTGETKTSDVTPPADAPEGDATYIIDPSFTAPEGWTVSIDEKTGKVTAVAPNDASKMVAFEVPVVATYPNNEVRTTTAPFSPLKTEFPAPEYNQVVVETGATQTSKITPAEGAPAGDVKYAIDPNWKAPEGWTVTIAEDGTVTAVAPDDATQMKAFEVPVTATYSDGQTRKTTAPFSPLVSTTREIQFETEIIYDDTVPAGINKVEQEGVKGEETFENGEWTETKAPVKQIVRIGTKANVGENEITWTKPIPFETTVRVNPDLAPGEIKTVTEGVVGEESFTQKVTTDGEGNVTLEEPTSEVTKPKVDAVIEIGPEVTDGTIEREWTTEVPFDVIYEYDETLPEGEYRVVTEGVAGEKTTTWSQKIEDSQPVGDPTVTENVTKEPVNEVVKIGKKKPDTPVEEETRPVPYETVVIYDDTLAYGSTEYDQIGVLGEETKQADGTFKQTKDPVKQIIRVGTKGQPVKPVEGTEEVNWTEPIPFEVEYVYNPNLEPGTTKTVQEGVAGETTKTVTVTFDSEGNAKQSAPESAVTKEPVKEIIEYGPGVGDTRTLNRTDNIPFNTEYIVDPTLDEGEEVVVQEGKDGSRTVTTTITVVDGKIVGEPVIAESDVVQPVKKIVRIGTKEVIAPVEKRSVDYPTQIVYDPNKPAGESEITQDGVLGEETRQPDGSYLVTEQPKAQIITIGTKLPDPVTGEDKVVWTEPLPYETIYRENPDLEPGEVKEVQKGELGEKTNTVTVTFDEDGNATQSPVETETTKEPVERILEIGPGFDDSKTIERVDDIPFETEYIIDDTLEEGQQVVDQVGEPGSKTVTTTIFVVDGKIIPEDPQIDEKITKEPVKQIVRIGVKKVVAPVETRPVDYPTEYVFDETLPPGETKVDQEGVLGEETLINGEWKTTKAPTPQVIRVGTKVSVGSDAVRWTEPIPFDVETRENPDLKPGEWRVVQEGETGLRSNTVNITVDENGNPILGETVTEVLKDPSNKIIEVGPGVDDEIVDEREETIPFETIVKYDPTLGKGEYRIEGGKNGSKTVTSRTPVVNGKVGETVITEEITAEPEQRIIWVGELDPDAAEELPYETEVEVVTDGSLKPGEKKVIRPGQPGLRELINGEWVTTREPVAEIIAVGPEEPVTPEDPSSEGVFKRCVQNAFAVNSPLLWLLPIGIAAAVGGPLAPMLQKQFASVGDGFNKSAIGQQWNAFTKRTRERFGQLGAGFDDPTREMREAIQSQFNVDTSALNEINAQLGGFAKQNQTALTAAMAIAAGLAIAGMIYQACQEDGFTEWGIPAGSSEEEKQAAKDAAAEISSSTEDEATN